MDISQEIIAGHEDMTSWRRHIHRHPETAFEEHNTSEFVAEKLESFGIEVDRGLAGTGVVGIIKGDHPGERAIGLRADLDALHIHEQTNCAHASQVDGKMHACGHDGHTVMLLGAAKHLAQTRDFAGTVYVIFQPAEENEGGGRVMVEDGLFEKFEMESVFGMHNWPGMPSGQFGVKSGPMMASYDIFDIKVVGKGGHGAMPHQGIDPVVIAAQIVSALQTIASRSVNPLDALVVSVTQIHGGDAYNVIPAEVDLKGTVRAFRSELQDEAEDKIRKISQSVAEGLGGEAQVHYERRYPPTVNSEAETQIAEMVAKQVAGENNVISDLRPSMGSEDFAFMLNEKPGSYVWIGAGEETANLHSPHYDFNDAILPVGAAYWVGLAEKILGRFETS